MHNLAKFIKERRRALGISQETLAERLEIDPTYVSKLENGATPFPIKRAGNLARALEIRTEEAITAILGPEAKNPEAVKRAFQAVEERNRGTVRLSKKRAESSAAVARIPIYFEIAARGTDITEKGAEIGHLEVLSSVVAGHTTVAFQVKEDAFRIPIPKGTRILALATQTFPGDEVILETKDRKVYWGIIEKMEPELTVLHLYDVKSTRQKVARPNIWVIYRVESKHRPLDPEQGGRG